MFILDKQEVVIYQVFLNKRTAVQSLNDNET